MPDIKLRDGSGVEQTYTGVDTITVPLADGSGNFTYGLTDEELNLSDGQEHRYFFAVGSPLYSEKYYKDNYILKRANLAELGSGGGYNYSGKGLFYNNLYIEDLSEIVIGTRASGTEDSSFDEIFCGCKNLRKLPNFQFKRKIYGNQTSRAFDYCINLEQTEIDKIYQFIGAFSNYSQSPQISYCYKIKEFDWGKINIDFDDFSPNRIDFGYAPTLEKYVIPATYTKSETTSNRFEARYQGSYPMLKDVSFVTNKNGSPKKSKMTNQTLSWWAYSESYSWGYGDVTSEGYLYGGIDRTHNIVGQTIEETQANYEKMKQYSDWHCTMRKNVNYQRSSVPIGRLFSKFNHKTMVSIINTIMDTSEYIASKGGTNTIKFYKYQGDLTDEGGASNLTEEEIAVATAKGWTIALV